MKLKPWKLRTKIALLSFALVLVSVLFAGVVIIERTTSSAEREIGLRALAIARTMAELRDVQENLGRPEGSKAIQPVAEKIRQATGVEYIVIFDMERIRYSHPLQDRIGTLFDDGDEGPALRKQEYLSQALGVLGPSIRAFVPVMTDEGTRQVGVVAVGILVPTITEALRSLHFQLYSSLLVGVVMGLLGSYYLARNIKQNMFSLEPKEIARILEERIAIFQAIGEGVIAVDREENVTIWNQEARRIVGSPTVEEKPLAELGILPGLRETMRTAAAQFNREIVLCRTLVLADFLPVKVKDKCVGAVTVFRAKTDVQKMAEELTGVKAFIEALRVQNHESLNKLHTIAGLIQLGKAEQAVDYIFSVTEEQQEVTRFLGSHIRDASVAGLLLGKYSRAKELKVELMFEPESELKEGSLAIDAGTLVIILGNLLENALEAVADSKVKEVYCLLKQEHTELVLSVEDTGPGIPVEHQSEIFQWGYTTKGKGGTRGVGLYIVRQAVESAQGLIQFESGAWGTRFLIRIPTRHLGDSGEASGENVYHAER